MVFKKCHEYWHSLCSLQGTGSFCFQEPSTMLCLLVSFGAIGTFVQILKISPTPTWVHDFLLKAPSRQMQPKSTRLGKQRERCLNQREASSTGPIPGHLYTTRMEGCGQSTLRISLGTVIWFLRGRLGEKEHCICTEPHKRLRKMSNLHTRVWRKVIKMIGPLK